MLDIFELHDRLGAAFRGIQFSVRNLGWEPRGKGWRSSGIEIVCNPLLRMPDKKTGELKWVEYTVSITKFDTEHCYCAPIDQVIKRVKSATEKFEKEVKRREKGGER